jgi:hypothetical protein
MSVAPPGYWMLFVLRRVNPTDKHVPSVAWWTKIIY